MEIFFKQSRLAKTRGAVRDSLHTDTLLIVTWILTGIFQSGKSVPGGRDSGVLGRTGLESVGEHLALPRTAGSGE